MGRYFFLFSSVSSVQRYVREKYVNERCASISFECRKDACLEYVQQSSLLLMTVRDLEDVDRERDRKYFYDVGCLSNVCLCSGKQLSFVLRIAVEFEIDCIPVKDGGCIRT